jgi:hypothetical protein
VRRRHQIKSLFSQLERTCLTARRTPRFETRVDLQKDSEKVRKDKLKPH